MTDFLKGYQLKNKTLVKVHNVDGTAMLIKKDGGTPEEWVQAYCDLLKAARHCNYLPCMDFASWVLGLSGNTLAELEEAWEIANKDSIPF